MNAMKMREMSRVCALAVLTASTCMMPSSGQAMEATLIADAFSVTTSSANFGKKKTLDVEGNPSASPLKRTLLQFDLAAAIPTGTTGADVNQATLTLYVTKVIAAGSFDVLRVTSPWTEYLVNGAGPTLGAAEATAIPITTASKDQFIVIDVTSVVRDWLNGTLVNNGLALTHNNSTGVKVKFDSRESTAASKPPRLDIQLDRSPRVVTQVDNSPLGLAGTNQKNVTSVVRPVTGTYCICLAPGVSISDCTTTIEFSQSLSAGSTVYFAEWRRSNVGCSSPNPCSPQGRVNIETSKLSGGVKVPTDDAMFVLTCY